MLDCGALSPLPTYPLPEGEGASTCASCTIEGKGKGIFYVSFWDQVDPPDDFFSN